ncbi:hypothetical protein [Yinghuangia seranimata]|uniref:phage baseplate protein n=1 Tax=Yinghuangia seranimata TaxID=408067 RepID=UPI00248B8181|nr:hypothetical protein [Yinghuangia seranimata]MDI2125107.1 hypothetical protein [Yinghuangia seranimata]
MTDRPRPFAGGPRRRTVLRAVAAVAALGAGAGGVAAACSDPADQPAPEAVPPSAPERPTVPDSVRFDLAAPATELFRERPLAGRDTVMQSFAFDDAGRRVFAAQIRDRAAGDLTLTRLTWDGVVDGAMVLEGFGHGTQIGVERVANDVFVWVESHAAQSEGAGWGRRVSRVKFRDRDTVESGGKHAPSFDLVPDAWGLSCSVDTAYGQMAVRYNTGGSIRYRVYDLAEVRSGRRTPRCELPAPPMHPTADEPEPSAQGFALFGRYLYTLEGTAYGAPGSVAPVGNTYLTCTDLSVPGGRVAAVRTVRDGADLRFREPEGVAVQRPAGPGGPARLVFGLASYAGSATDPERLATLIGIDATVTDP